jgi:hypothetical protein
MVPCQQRGPLNAKTGIRSSVLWQYQMGFPYGRNQPMMFLRPKCNCLLKAGRSP